MRCSTCQSQLKNAAIFCDTCGTKQEKNSQATISLSKAPTPIKQPTPSYLGQALGGFALFLLGVWVGSSFLSEPTPVPRELAASAPLPTKSTATQDTPLVTVPSVPATPATAPVVSVEASPKNTPEPPKTSELTNPFAKKQPENNSLKTNPDGTLTPKFKTTSRDEISDPFRAQPPKPQPAKGDVDPDSSLNPFKKKKASDDTITDPFSKP